MATKLISSIQAEEIDSLSVIYGENITIEYFCEDENSYVTKKDHDDNDVVAYIEIKIVTDLPFETSTCKSQYLLLCVDVLKTYPDTTLPHIRLAIARNEDTTKMIDSLHMDKVIQNGKHNNPYRLVNSNFNIRKYA